MNLYRIQFYPTKALADILNAEAQKSGVSVSKFVTDFLENYYGLSGGSAPSITQLTADVLKEVEEYIKANGTAEFDLNTASPTYRSIDMTCGKKPSTVRASIGRSFAGRIGKPPFKNVKKCIVDGKQKLSTNNALVYETFCTAAVSGASEAEIEKDQPLL